MGRPINSSVAEKRLGLSVGKDDLTRLVDHQQRAGGGLSGDAKVFMGAQSFGVLTAPLPLTVQLHVHSRQRLVLFMQLGTGCLKVREHRVQFLQ